MPGFFLSNRSCLGKKGTLLSTIRVWAGVHDRSGLLQKATSKNRKKHRTDDRFPLADLQVSVLSIISYLWTPPRTPKYFW